MTTRTRTRTPTPDDLSRRAQQRSAAQARLKFSELGCPRCKNIGFWGRMQPRKDHALHEARCLICGYRAQV